MFLGEGNPVRLIESVLSSWNDATFDPVVDDVVTDTELPGDLWHRQFSRSLPDRSWDAVFVTDPGDHRGGERSSLRAELPGLVQVDCDLAVAVVCRETSDLLDNFGWISQAIGHFCRQWDCQVLTLATHPTSMQYGLTWFITSLDRNVLQQQAQHSFAILG